VHFPQKPFFGVWRNARHDWPPPPAGQPRASGARGRSGVSGDAGGGAGPPGVPLPRRPGGLAAPPRSFLYHQAAGSVTPHYWRAQRSAAAVAPPQSLAVAAVISLTSTVRFSFSDLFAAYASTIGARPSAAVTFGSVSLTHAETNSPTSRSYAFS
jgi:hypothetical protein